jgi:ribosome-associated protein
MIVVTPEIGLDEKDLVESFIRASGPGGQNVNKVSSAVQLRFDVRQCRALPDPVAVRLMRLAGSKLTRDGVIVLTADRFRTQERNRADARERLVALIVRAATPPVPRRATKVPRAAKAKRVEGKVQRGTVKAGRGRVRDE